MSTEQNKSITRRWIEQGWNKGELSIINEIYNPAFLQHESEPATVNSAEALKHYVMAFRSGMPDLHFTIDDLIAEGDKVVWRFTATGTHQGELWGIPPTGKNSTVTGIVEFRFADSKIAEAWVNFDTLGMLQQIGIIPAMGA